MTAPPTLGTEVVAHFDYGHTQPWQGCEVKSASVGDGYAVTAYVTEQYAVAGADYHWSVRVVKVDTGLGITLGSELLIPANDSFSPDLSGVAYLGSNIVCLTSQGDPVAVFLRVNKASMTVTEVDSVANPTAGSPADVVSTVMSDGQDRGVIRLSVPLADDQLVWVDVSSGSVSTTTTTETSGLTDYMTACEYAVESDGSVVFAGAYTPNDPLARFDIDWAAHTYTYDTYTIADYWTTFPEETAVAHRAGTTSLVFPRTTDRFGFVREWGGGDVTSYETVITSSIAQITTVPFARWVHLVRLPDGSLLLSWNRNDAARFLSWASSDQYEEPDVYDGIPSDYWLYDGTNLVDLGSGLIMFVCTGYGAGINGGENSVYWRALRVGSPPPLRQNQRDDTRQNQHTSRQLTVRQRGYL